MQIAGSLRPGSLRRIKVCGWGRQLARHAARSSHPHGAPARMGCGWAELFACWPVGDAPDPAAADVELPVRPDFYAAVGLSSLGIAARVTMPRVQCADDLSDGSEVGESEWEAESEGEEGLDSGPEAADGGSSGEEHAGGGHADGGEEEEEATRSEIRWRG